MTAVAEADSPGTFTSLPSIITNGMPSDSITERGRSKSKKIGDCRVGSRYPPAASEPMPIARARTRASVGRNPREAGSSLRPRPGQAEPPAPVNTGWSVEVRVSTSARNC